MEPAVPLLVQLPPARQAAFIHAWAAYKRTVAAFWVFASLLVTYEVVRFVDLGFNPLRLVVYVPMSLLLLALCVVGPIRNMRQFRRLVGQYSFEPTKASWTFIPLFKKGHQVVQQPPVVGQFAYFTEMFPAQVFTQPQQTWYFPLSDPPPQKGKGLRRQ